MGLSGTRVHSVGDMCCRSANNANCPLAKISAIESFVRVFDEDFDENNRNRPCAVAADFITCVGISVLRKQVNGELSSELLLVNGYPAHPKHSDVWSKGWSHDSL